MVEKIYRAPRIRLLADRTAEPDENGTYPRIGLEFKSDIHNHMIVPTSWVSKGLDEGWLVAVNARPVVKPGGPPSNPWREENRHFFLHIDEIFIDHIDGTAHYKVVQQPDKYDAEGNPFDGVGDPTAVVNYFYLMDLVEDN